MGIVVTLLDDCGVYLYLHTLLFLDLFLDFFKWILVIVNDIYL